MAPESERARTIVTYGECTKCASPIAQIGQWEHIDKFMDDDHDANPKEPTLTCSEVVERLATEAFRPAVTKFHDAWFNRAIATQILHSWRERRVQELEECLREIMVFTNPECTPTSAAAMTAYGIAEAALALNKEKK